MELCVRLPPDLCMEMADMSAPAAIGIKAIIAASIVFFIFIFIALSYLYFSRFFPCPMNPPDVTAGSSSGISCRMNFMLRKNFPAMTLITV